jgi:uncharacterized phage-associated protein
LGEKVENNLSAIDVASYILQKMGPMTTMKLQKLIYYCQAWSLVWDEQPLFIEQIEAWANGPVVWEVFNLHRNRFIIQKMEGAADKLSQTQKETVDAVLKYYGDKSSQWLTDLTHKEEPWRKAREGLLPGERGESVITHASMFENYNSL